MADPYVREVGRVSDSLDGLELTVGVDYDTVTLGSGLTRWRFSQHQAEEFAQLFVSACWQAGIQARQMAEERWDTVHPIRPDGSHETLTEDGEP